MLFLCRKTEFGTKLGTNTDVHGFAFLGILMDGDEITRQISI